MSLLLLYNNANPGPPPVVVASGSLVDYLFEFPSLGAAQSDPVVGPYFAAFSGLSNNVLVYDRLVSSALPLLGYWCMISQMAPINGALINHPDLVLAINRTAQLANQQSVLRAIGVVPANLSIMLGGAGVHTLRGLF